MKNDRSVNLKTIFLLSGAIVAFLIGSATATGQESMQFFAANGYLGIGSVIIFTILLAWAGGSIIALGHSKKEEVDSVYKYYLGNIFGTIFEWIAMLFLYGVVVTMLAGAGSVVNAMFGISNYIGAIIIGGLVFLTIILSLEKIVNILGSIGPILIIFLFLISIIGVVTNFDGLMNAGQAIKNVEVPSASSFWWLSGILYCAHAIIVAAPFFIRLGSGSSMLTNRREATTSGVSAALVAFIPLMIMFLAVLANIEFVFDKDTPLVHIAQNIHPFLAAVFSIIVLLGIYSTAAPMLWTVCDKIFPNKTKGYTILAACLTIFALVGGATLPFGQLVGILYPITGYVGIILFIAIGYKQIMNRRKKAAESEDKAITS